MWTMKTRREALALGAASALMGFTAVAQKQPGTQLDFRPGLPNTSEPKPSEKAVRFGQDALGRNATHPDWSAPIKVATAASKGALFVFENSVFLSPRNFGLGGPPEHFHHSQDELFYVLEGQVTIQIDKVRHVLNPGDCILGPRLVPHVWDFSSLGQNRILIALTPADRFEDFLLQADRDAARMDDPAFNEAHGMTIVGPSLKLVRQG
jgi:mannose-6-phosphate isomerase-like protein (cupin superfamily)